MPTRLDEEAATWRAVFGRACFEMRRSTLIGLEKPIRCVLSNRANKAATVAPPVGLAIKLPGREDTSGRSAPFFSPNLGDLSVYAASNPFLDDFEDEFLDEEAYQRDDLPEGLAYPEDNDTPEEAHERQQINMGRALALWARRTAFPILQELTWDIRQGIDERVALPLLRVVVNDGGDRVYIEEMQKAHDEETISMLDPEEAEAAHQIFHGRRSHRKQASYATLNAPTNEQISRNARWLTEKVCTGELRGRFVCVFERRSLAEHELKQMGFPDPTNLPDAAYPLLVISESARHTTVHFGLRDEAVFRRQDPTGSMSPSDDDFFSELTPDRVLAHARAYLDGNVRPTLKTEQVLVMQTGHYNSRKSGTLKHLVFESFAEEVFEMDTTMPTAKETLVLLHTPELQTWDQASRLGRRLAAAVAATLNESVSSRFAVASYNTRKNHMDVGYSAQRPPTHIRGVPRRGAGPRQSVRKARDEQIRWARRSANDETLAPRTDADVFGLDEMKGPIGMGGGVFEGVPEFHEDVEFILVTRDGTKSDDANKVVEEEGKGKDENEYLEMEEEDALATLDTASVPVTFHRMPLRPKKQKKKKRRSKRNKAQKMRVPTDNELIKFLRKHTKILDGKDDALWTSLKEAMDEAGRLQGAERVDQRQAELDACFAEEDVLEEFLRDQPDAPNKHGYLQKSMFPRATRDSKTELKSKKKARTRTIAELRRLQEEIDARDMVQYLLRQGEIEDRMIDVDPDEEVDPLPLSTLLPEVGQEAKMEFELAGLDSGNIIESGRRVIRVGHRDVIECWDEAAQMMRPGDRVVLLCRSPVAYGPTGLPPKVGPGESIRLSLEMLDISGDPQPIGSLTGEN